MLPKQVWWICLLAATVMTKSIDQKNQNRAGGHNARDHYSGLDPLGGGNLLRHPGNQQGLPEHQGLYSGLEHVRDVDALGGGNLLRSQLRDVDALGGGYLLRGEARDVDPLGGGNLLREPVSFQMIPEYRGTITGCKMIPTFLCLDPMPRLPEKFPGGASSKDLSWKRHGDIDPLSGTGFGVQKRINPLTGAGFGFQKRLKLLNGSRRQAFGYSKRNFDEIDRSGFSRFYKRNQMNKRNFDEIENSGFNRFYRSQLSGR